MDGWVTSISLYLDAWIPLGRPVITHISHTIVAIGFFVFGTHYVYNTISMAKILTEIEDNGILGQQLQMMVNLRTAFFVIMLISGMVVVVTTPLAVTAHGRLLDHQFRGTKESQMNQTDIVKCRRLEAFMSTAQMVLGIALGLTLFTAAVDVLLLMDNSSVGDRRQIVAEEFWAIAMAVTMLFLTVVEYWYRHKIYIWCQAMLLRFRMSQQSNTTKDE